MINHGIGHKREDSHVLKDTALVNVKGLFFFCGWVVAVLPFPKQLEINAVAFIQLIYLD